MIFQITQKVNYHFLRFSEHFLDHATVVCYFDYRNYQEAGVIVANNSIGSTLKAKRTEKALSVEQVSSTLVSLGFKASPKTIYSWESGNSQPTPDALLAMCALYDITDVLSAFGYAPKERPAQTDRELSQLVRHYEASTDEGRSLLLRIGAYTAHAAKSGFSDGQNQSEGRVLDSLARQAGLSE